MTSRRPRGTIAAPVMDYDVALGTTTPILLLIGLGYFSRKAGLFKAGDERPLNAYVYYFALPALFLVNLAETELGWEHAKFVAAGAAPILIVSALYAVLYLLIRFPRRILYLLIVATVFGSTAFYGIPFVMFAFPSAGENLAVLGAASASVVAVSISITLLEFYRLEAGGSRAELGPAVKGLLKNPLILAILGGLAASLLKIAFPKPLSRVLHMLGGTTATVAIFVLGVFLYGRTYRSLPKALGLSLLRALVLPGIGVSISLALGLPPMERGILTVMHSAPLAVSMIVLSERYGFYKETIASVILVSSLSASVYLNVWLVAVGSR